MYQPNISKSPLLSAPIIERDYATGTPEPTSVSTAETIPAPAPEPAPAPAEPVKRKVIKMGKKPEKPAPAPAPDSAPNQTGEQTQQQPESDPVDAFSFADEAENFGDAEGINPDNVDVEIPDDVAKETGKQLTLLVDMLVAMLCERKMLIDMNSIKVAIAKGEMHPIFEEKFELVNENNRKVAHLSPENKKAFTQALVAIIKDQKIQALNPTNASIATIVMIAISHYGTVSATIASNERMIASALVKTTSNEVTEPAKDSNIPEVENNRVKKI